MTDKWRTRRKGDGGKYLANGAQSRWAQPHLLVCASCSSVNTLQKNKFGEVQGETEVRLTEIRAIKGNLVSATSSKKTAQKSTQNSDWGQALSAGEPSCAGEVGWASPSDAAGLPCEEK